MGVCYIRVVSYEQTTKLESNFIDLKTSKKNKKISKFLLTNVKTFDNITKRHGSDVS